jgi:hypothetical protein
MNKQQFKDFVNKNKLESHWLLTFSKHINLIVPSYLILEFQKTLCLSTMNEKALECVMCNDYFVFEIYNFLEYEGLEYDEIKSIFPELDNNI